MFSSFQRLCPVCPSVLSLIFPAIGRFHHSCTCLCVDAPRAHPPNQSVVSGKGLRRRQEWNERKTSVTALQSSSVRLDAARDRRAAAELNSWACNVALAPLLQYSKSVSNCSDRFVGWWLKGERTVSRRPPSAGRVWCQRSRCRVVEKACCSLPGACVALRLLAPYHRPTNLPYYSCN